MAKSKEKSTKNEKFQLYNKKAKFNFELSNFLETGIVLQGSEVKSLRQKKGNLTDGFCRVRGGEIWLENLSIPPYKDGGYSNHLDVHPRKLLLHKKEILKIDRQIREKGLVLVATRVYFNDKNRVKVEIALGKPKKLYDKRDDIQKKEAKIEVDRALKHRSRRE